MYPRNAASPERIAIGQVVLIADGTVQSASVTITVRGQGGAEASGGGTTAFGADNTVYYTPTQAETNFTSFVVIASKASCFSASQTIITSASSTPGNVILAGVTHTSAVIPTVTTLTGHTAQTGDSFALIGTDGQGLTDLGGSGNNWNVGKTGYTLTATTGLGTQSGTVGGIAGTITTLDALNTATDGSFTEIKGATWATTDSLEAIRNQGDAAWATATGFATNTKQDTMETTLNAAATAASIAALNDAPAVSVADILTTQMTESYAADGAAPTLTQALMLIQQQLGDFSITGTTMTVKKVDGSTTAATFTLDDGTNPTSLTRAT